ncbi:MAG: GyrI-like domain-containing protein, partial [Bacteroidales bacterium]|nr:GyrI-like domain-containing protein [Bacteroidales bacterium]
VSEYHFHRIFKAYIGESIGSYISRLRLENAAQKLQTTNQTLTEIAEKTGYQSQYSLSKAFKKHFGVTPSAFRNIQSYFSSQIAKPKHEPIELHPQIIEVQKKNLVYIRIIAKYGEELDYDTAWRKLWKYAKQNELVNDDNEFIGLAFDDPIITKSEQCRFYACISTGKAIKPSGEFGSYTIEPGKYAVFTLKGSYSGLSRLYHSIYYDWLSNSNERIRNSMPFEKYLNNPDKVKETDLLTEVWLPIK